MLKFSRGKLVSGKYLKNTVKTSEIRVQSYCEQTHQDNITTSQRESHSTNVTGKKIVVFFHNLDK